MRNNSRDYLEDFILMGVSLCCGIGMGIIIERGIQSNPQFDNKSNLIENFETVITHKKIPVADTLNRYIK